MDMDGSPPSGIGRPPGSVSDPALAAEPLANFCGEFATTLIYLIPCFDSASKNSAMAMEFIG